ncbi:jg172, partial [Pararge aegeria aegeria]
ITESLKRLRAKKASRINEDIDFENSVANLENRIKISDKILESVGIGSTEISGARRALKENEERTEKRIARRLNEENPLTKWTALKDFDDETAAVHRAKATRARLTDLEDEMTELNERSAAREKRAARLRALVADTEADSTVTTSNVASSKISIRSEREKKQVTF